MPELYTVLRARAHNQLTAHTATLAEATRLAGDWQARREGPAVVVRETTLRAGQARARRSAERSASALADPDLAALVKLAEHDAMLRLLYSRLPFVACQPGGVPGVVYLICFDRPYKHAHHYLGWCETGRLEARMVEHRTGAGARLMAVVTAAGIGWNVARTWDDADRYFERMCKLRRDSTRLCPQCNPGNHRGVPAAPILIGAPA
jgi:hypothetical protein